MEIDWETIHASLHAIASQALLEGVIHQRDKTRVDNEAIHDRVNESIALIHSEIICAQQLETDHAT